MLKKKVQMLTQVLYESMIGMCARIRDITGTNVVNIKHFL